MDPFWTIFVLIFRPVLGPFRRPFWSQNGPRSINMGSRRSSRASKYRKAAFAKHVILFLWNHTFRVLGALKTSVRGSKRLSIGTWRALRPEKRFQNLTGKFHFLGSVLRGSITEPEISTKLTPKWNQTHVNLFIGVFDFYQNKKITTNMFTLGKHRRANRWVRFWIPFWTPTWAHKLLKMELKRPWCAKMDPRRASRASKYRKTAIAKSVILRMENHTFLFLGSQDKHKRLKTALQDSKNNVSKIDCDCFYLFTGFGADLGPNTDPKIHRKSIKQKMKN